MVMTPKREEMNITKVSKVWKICAIFRNKAKSDYSNVTSLSEINVCIFHISIQGTGAISQFRVVTTHAEWLHVTGHMGT